TPPTLRCSLLRVRAWGTEKRLSLPLSLDFFQKPSPRSSSVIYETGSSLMEQRRIVDAFLDALRRGDFEGLVAVLDPEVVVRIDEAAASPGAARQIRGAENWARGAITFSRQLAGVVQPMLINGAVGLVWSPGGHVFRVLCFSFADGNIATADVIADPAHLHDLQLAVLDK
ncbi:MAG TPA: hypothetical protein VMG82_13150, partial [Candidatus Sulfotelmatobacter sp.]|nr:hypothetical protein [Candidatus Sulfotelmatobacter sp.]